MPQNIFYLAHVSSVENLGRRIWGLKYLGRIFGLRLDNPVTGYLVGGRIIRSSLKPDYPAWFFQIREGGVGVRGHSTSSSTPDPPTVPGRRPHILLPPGASPAAGFARSLGIWLSSSSGSFSTKWFLKWLGVISSLSKPRFMRLDEIIVLLLVVDFAPRWSISSLGSILSVYLLSIYF